VFSLIHNLKKEGICNAHTQMASPTKKLVNAYINEIPRTFKIVLPFKGIKTC
jgi:hypothetical protein